MRRRCRLRRRQSYIPLAAAAVVVFGAPDGEEHLVIRNRLDEVLSSFLITLMYSSSRGVPSEFNVEEGKDLGLKGACYDMF